MDMAPVTLLIHILLLCLLVSGQSQNSTTMNCSLSPMSSCVSYLYLSHQLHSLPQIATSLNINITDVLDPPSGWTRSISDYVIAVNCNCISNIGFLAKSTFTPTKSEKFYADVSSRYYDHLVYMNATKNPVLTTGVPLEIELVCGCPTAEWKSVLAYSAEKLDTLDELAARFSSDSSTIQFLSGIVDRDQVAVNQNLFIPINIIPTAKSSSLGKSSTGLIIGIVVGVLLLLVVVLVTAIIYWRKRRRIDKVSLASSMSGGPYSRKLPNNSTSSRRTASFSVTNLFSFGRPSMGSVNNNVKRSITLPREAMNVFDQEKPVIFNYEEIIAATNNFSEARKLGQGAFGIVYSGSLRQQDVAIKQMKATKSREFLAELKVLCKVHHTNLVELIGYSAGDESLFLVYEFAEHGALSDHLYNRAASNNDNPPLSWTARVQVALDAARGLEYIHEHTKTHYVHRDVKTSNILLDGYFRAKIADFGLAKLVEQTADIQESTTRVVGTFGYMAPEYVLDGHATSKTDVYAFGVVLFQLITGLPAMSREKYSSSSPKPAGRRSLISRMLVVLKEADTMFKSYVDPDLGDCYPFDCAFKMAKLAKACVEEEPSHRPDMRQIVFFLSQNLLNSVEWEASLAGSSQIFSGLVQGR